MHSPPQPTDRLRNREGGEEDRKIELFYNNTKVYE